MKTRETQDDDCKCRNREGERKKESVASGGGVREKSWRKGLDIRLNLEVMTMAWKIYLVLEERLESKLLLM